MQFQIRLRSTKKSRGRARQHQLWLLGHVITRSATGGGQTAAKDGGDDNGCRRQPSHTSHLCTRRRKRAVASEGSPKESKGLRVPTCCCFLASVLMKPQIIVVGYVREMLTIIFPYKDHLTFPDFNFVCPIKEVVFS